MPHDDHGIFGTPDTTVAPSTGAYVSDAPESGFNRQAEAYSYALLAEIEDDLAIFHNRVLNAVIPDGYKSHLLECIEVIHRKAGSWHD